MTRLVVISNRVSIPEPGKSQAGGLAVAACGVYACTRCTYLRRFAGARPGRCNSS